MPNSIHPVLWSALVGDDRILTYEIFQNDIRHILFGAT